MKQLSSDELKAEVKWFQNELTKRRRKEALTLSSKKKREQRTLKKQQVKRDEVFDLSDLFENQTRYTGEHFTNKITIIYNKVTSLLDEGLVVEISGLGIYYNWGI